MCNRNFNVTMYELDDLVLRIPYVIMIWNPICFCENKNNYVRWCNSTATIPIIMNIRITPLKFIFYDCSWYSNICVILFCETFSNLFIKIFKVVSELHNREKTDAFISEWIFSAWYYIITFKLFTGRNAGLYNPGDHIISVKYLLSLISKLLKSPFLFFCKEGNEREFRKIV